MIKVSWHIITSIAQWYEKMGVPDAESVLKRLDQTAVLLDAKWKIPCTSMRFGISPIIGVVPGVGDTISAVISCAPVIEAFRLKVGVEVPVKMLGNILLDWAVGIIPVFGDMFDFGFRENLRNVALLEHELRRQGRLESPTEELLPNICKVAGSCGVKMGLQPTGRTAVLLTKVSKKVSLCKRINRRIGSKVWNWSQTQAASALQHTHRRFAFHSMSRAWPPHS